MNWFMWFLIGLWIGGPCGFLAAALFHKSDCEDIYLNSERE